MSERRLSVLCVLAVACHATVAHAGFTYVSADRGVEARGNAPSNAAGDRTDELGFFAGEIELGAARATLESALEPDLMDFRGELRTSAPFFDASVATRVTFDVAELTPVLLSFDIQAPQVQDPEGPRATIALGPEDGGEFDFLRVIDFFDGSDQLGTFLTLEPGRYAFELNAIAIGAGGSETVVYDVSLTAGAVPPPPPNPIPLPPAAWAGLSVLSAMAVTRAIRRRLAARG